MSDIDWDEIWEAFQPPEPPPDPDPDFRATYRARRLTVVRWFPGLADIGPPASFFRQREKAGTAIADLTVHESKLGDELSLTFKSAGRNRLAAERAIAGWAALVGFRRVWYYNRLVEIEPSVGPNDTAAVTCTTCGQLWSDEGQRFWSMVIRAHAFPSFCPLCGADLPVWKIDGRRNPVMNVLGAGWDQRGRPIKQR
jgi:hypothetical protein